MCRRLSSQNFNKLPDYVEKRSETHQRNADPGKKGEKNRPGISSGAGPYVTAWAAASSGNYLQSFLNSSATNWTLGPIMT